MVDLPSSSWASPTDRYLVGPVQKKSLKKKSHLYKKQASRHLIYIHLPNLYIIYVNRDAASIGGSSRSSTKVTRMCSSGTLGMENCLRGWNMCHFRVGVGLGLGLGGLDQYEHLLPRKLTCPLKINGWKMYFLLKWSLFRGHVSFPGCKTRNSAFGRNLQRHHTSEMTSLHLTRK